MDENQSAQKRNKQVRVMGDLREKLNMKKAEKEQKQNGPPPDPSYNFLRDPERDGDTSSSNAHRKQYRPDSPRFNMSQHKPFRPNYKRDNYKKPEKLDLNQPTYNIKVEFTTESGERTCTVDKDHPLPPINVREEKSGRKTFQKNMQKPMRYNHNNRSNNFHYYKKDHGNQESEVTEPARNQNYYPRREYNRSRGNFRGHNRGRGEQRKNEHVPNTRQDSETPSDLREFTQESNYLRDESTTAFSSEKDFLPPKKESWQKPSGMTGKRTTKKYFPTSQKKSMDKGDSVTTEKNSTEKEDGEIPIKQSIEEEVSRTPEKNYTEKQDDVMPEKQSVEKQDSVAPEKNSREKDFVIPEKPSIENEDFVALEQQPTERENVVKPEKQSIEKEDSVALEQQSTEKKHVVMPEKQSRAKDSVTLEQQSIGKNAATLEEQSTENEDSATFEKQSTGKDSVTLKQQSTKTRDSVTLEKQFTGKDDSKILAKENHSQLTENDVSCNSEKQDDKSESSANDKTDFTANVVNSQQEGSKE